MEFSASKRKLSDQELSTSSKRSKRDTEDSLESSFSRYVAITNPYAIQLSVYYNTINQKIRNAVYEARRVRDGIQQTIIKHDITQDKDIIESHYTPINNYLKYVQFNTN